VEIIPVRKLKKTKALKKRKIADSDEESYAEGEEITSEPNKSSSFRDIHLDSGAFSFSQERSEHLESNNTHPKAAGLKLKSFHGNENSNGEAAPSYSKPKWLSDRLDLKKRRPGDEDYDPTTLYIPQSELAKMTPAQQQFWEIKSKNFDVVLFFKMGKFYELFDMDAEIGNRELDLQFMKGDRAHVGFPEICFEKYAESLIRLGYKVGRVEQTETPDQMKERNRISSGKKSKVVNREMISLLTKGTLVDPKLINKDDASYLLSLIESSDRIRFGVCFVDTSTGNFHIGEFDDDSSRTRLRTLLAQIRPDEILFPKNLLQEPTLKLLKKDLRHAITNCLQPVSQFWDKETTQCEISKTEYFKDSEIPKELNRLLSPVSENNLACSAFGGCLYYLRKVLLDSELMSIGRFSEYNPEAKSSSDFLILDGHTLNNLEILSNSEGTTFGSLLYFADHCITASGKRLFRDWLSRPLANISMIEERLVDVDYILKNFELIESVRKELKKIPDLERLLSRLNAFAIGRDKNAVMYENVDAQRVKIFLSVLDAYSFVLKLISYLRDYFCSIDSFPSGRLNHLTKIGDGFPDLSDELKHFNEAFDHASALKTGSITPYENVDDEFDAINTRIASIESQYEKILSSIKKKLNDRSIAYVHKNSEPYQLEISESTISRLGNDLPEEFEHLSRRKGFQRFWTPEIRDLNQEYDVLKEKKESILRDLNRRMFARFCVNFRNWRKAALCIAEIDCIFNLAIFSNSSDGPMCRPEFVDTDSPFLELKGVRHPCVSGISRAQFIPNDTFLATEENPSNFLMVTGPNMGGKSTLLRQTCLAVILAQLGCYVPAEVCKLSIVVGFF
jgi:DNA mismatch repair protein MSH6